MKNQGFYGRSQQQHQGQNIRYTFHFDNIHEAFHEFGFDMGKRVNHSYTSSNLNSNFPKQFSVKESILNPNPNHIHYSILIHQQATIGNIQHDVNNLSFKWLNEDNYVVAEASTTVAIGETPSWLQREYIRVTNEHKVHVGTIRITFPKIFPVYSRIELFDKKGVQFADCTRFAFMGTRLNWFSPHNHKQLGNAFRAFVCSFFFFIFCFVYLFFLLNLD